MGDTWRPTAEEAGSEIKGVVAKRGVAKTKFGDREFIDVRTTQGIRTIWLTPVLKKQIEKQGITEGDPVTVIYEGQAETKDGRTYNKFTITLDAEFKKKPRKSKPKTKLKSLKK